MRTEREYKRLEVENRRLRAALSGNVLALMRVEAQASELAKRAYDRIVAVGVVLSKNPGRRDADV